MKKMENIKISTAIPGLSDDVTRYKVALYTAFELNFLFVSKKFFEIYKDYLLSNFKNFFDKKIIKSLFPALIEKIKNTYNFDNSKKKLYSIIKINKVLLVLLKNFSEDDFNRINNTFVTNSIFYEKASEILAVLLKLPILTRSNLRLKNFWSVIRKEIVKQSPNPTPNALPENKAPINEIKNWINNNFPNITYIKTLTLKGPNNRATSYKFL
jgi:hypothetical protein